jgi:hypothetical protein
MPGSVSNIVEAIQLELPDWITSMLFNDGFSFISVLLILATPYQAFTNDIGIPLIFRKALRYEMASTLFREIISFHDTCREMVGH